jgi:cholesterol transport system auxiliary component
MSPASSIAAVVLIAYVGMAGATSSCALSSKADVVPIRYFSPEHLVPSSTVPARATVHELKLGRITSGSNLRERIAYRQARYELGYYDDLRWTERPETYVRRALGRALFESGHFRRTVHGPAPTLDIEVLAFDDLRIEGRRAASVVVKFILQDDTGVRIERTVAEETAVTGSEPNIEQVVEAMAQSLERSVQKVVLAIDDWFAQDNPPSNMNPTQDKDAPTER